MTDGDIKEVLSLDEVINSLNKMTKFDRQAMHDLVETRVQCQGIWDDVKCYPEDDGKLSVGLLGALNGLFGPWEHGPIAAIFDEDSFLVGFTKSQCTSTK